jgi:6-phosphofructokinase 1
MCLHYNYGVKDIYGILFGYKGFYDFDWKKLTVEDVANIHNIGGTVIGSSRGVNISKNNKF